MAAKPSRSTSAAISAFAAPSLPERKTTRRPPCCAGSAASTAAGIVLNAFTRRAPGTASATTSLEARPPRSLGENAGNSMAFVASTTILPAHRPPPRTASGTAEKGIASTTTSARSASGTETAVMFRPSSRAKSTSDAGPRWLATRTSMSQRANWVARACPMAPEPRMAKLIGLLLSSAEVCRRRVDESRSSNLRCARYGRSFRPGSRGYLRLGWSFSGGLRGSP